VSQIGVVKKLVLTGSSVGHRSKSRRCVSSKHGDRPSF